MSSGAFLGKGKPMWKKQWAGLGLIFGLLLIFVMPVYAGDINAAEQSIVSYYNGTVSYDGKTYQFTEAAKQQAYNKLMADDVDLTAAQAASAIRQANANLKQGIEQGYLVEVGGQSSGETETPEDGKTDTDIPNSETGDKNTEDGNTEGNGTVVPDGKDDVLQGEDSEPSKRPSYSDSQKTDLNDIIKDALNEGAYAAVNTGSQEEGTQSNDTSVTVEQFLKGTVNVVKNNGDVVLSTGLPIKNTGYYVKDIRPIAGIVCVLCLVLMIVVIRKKKGIYICMPVLTAVMGVAFFLTVASGLVKSEVGKWKSLWIHGAPEYTYAAELENEANSNKAGMTPLQGEQYGEILCDEIDLKAPLYYGDTDEIFEQGAGTYAGRNLPGQGGEILISGHDTTFFAPLASIQEGMVFLVKTNYGQYEYKVTGTEVLDVLEYNERKSETEELVLYTCYPFGAEEELRNERFFVYAEKISGQEIGE